ncbi:MAG: hypothetical protein KKD00_07840 [Gammaproteobacteria bacterium]|nr:hypothetical protein [Gammaproteobacteria bacterium]
MVDSFKRMISVVVLLILVSCSDATLPPVIDVQRVPDGGIHPRIVFDEWGDTHLLYFRAEFPQAGAYLGHLYYTRYNNDSGTWRPPVQVSAEPYNYRDPIYRANLAIDGDGRVHVVWFVDRPARFVYTRSTPDKSAFEIPRLIGGQHLDGIDAAADIASVDNRVALVWSAGDLMREDQRSVFMLESEDYGTNFSEAVIIADASLGACACCGLAAEFNQEGELMVAYRSAINNTGRHTQRLVIARNAQGDLQSSYQPVHALTEWELSSCPVTTNDIVRDETDAGDYWLAFENQHQVVKLNMSDGSVPEPVSLQPAAAREKHPSLAFNSAGYQLIAWGEGGGFFSGGMLRRALFDRDGNPVSLPALDELEIPDRSFAAAMVKPDGNFLILY